MQMISKMSLENIFTFSDKITDNYVEYEKVGSDVWILRHYIDPDNGKLFVMLLKESFTQMKNKGCTRYKQCVSFDDWEKYLKKSEHWNIISQNFTEKTMIIDCDIDWAGTLIIQGLLEIIEE